MFGQVPYLPTGDYLSKTPHMEKPTKLFNFKAPVVLIEKANATAQTNCQTLSAVIRRYLECYVAAQPQHGAK